MSAVLLLSCPDRRGIVAAVSSFLADHDANITHADQHVDTIGLGGGDGNGAVFFQRIEFDVDGFDLAPGEIAAAFAPVAERFGMDVTLRFADQRARVGILASKQPHCLADLLVRWSSGELAGDVAVVVSNHPDHVDLCAGLGVPYVHLPVAAGHTGVIDPEQETAVLDALAAHEAELVVLARYMRILSPRAIAAYPNRIINIHHSFLPAFIGANPYRQAHDRGVKLIGATAHYATDELDDGPIIAQATAPVSHRDDVARLTRAGRDLETTVLASAVRAHLEHRILVYGHKTVVF